MNDAAPAPEMESQPNQPYHRQLLIILIIAGAALLLVAMAILVYLGLQGAGQPDPATPSPTSTQTAESTAVAAASPIPAPSCETIISSGDAEVSVALPVSLTTGSAAYPVEPILPEGEAWTYPDSRSGTALWVCGTVVNYIVGIEPTVDNEQMLSDLAPGDEIRLQLSTGTVLIFRFSERRDALPGAEDVLTQQKPRLTLVLPESDRWQVAIADYAAEAEAVDSSPTGVSAEPGQPVELGQVRVTLTRGYLKQSEELQEGTAYYLTEFSVENMGDSPLPVDTFATQLKDSLGNTYLVSPRASELGEHGPLSGSIDPGASAQGSQGYMVPDPLSSGELTWIFSVRPGSESASVGIPYEGGTTDDTGPMQPEVTVTDAFLGDDGNTLIIEGEVWNKDTRSLVVESSDVALSSSAGLSDLVMEAPALPWTIEPGQRQVIELQYQRPEASTVLLELLGYSFEIGGLE